MEFNEDLLRLAAMNHTMPEGLKIADAMAYQALAHLYERYRQEMISKNDAAKEKCLILKSWEVAKLDEQLSAHHYDVIKNTETACSEFRKNPTVENAEKIVNVIDGLTNRHFKEVQK